MPSPLYARASSGGGSPFVSSSVSSSSSSLHARRETGIRITTKGERVAAAARAAASADEAARDPPTPFAPGAPSEASTPQPSSELSPPALASSVAVAARPPSPLFFGAASPPLAQLPGGGALKRLGVGGAGGAVGCSNPLFRKSSGSGAASCGSSVRSAGADSSAEATTEPKPGEGMALFDEP